MSKTFKIEPLDRMLSDVIAATSNHDYIEMVRTAGVYFTEYYNSVSGLELSKAKIRCMTALGNIGMALYCDQGEDEE